MFNTPFFGLIAAVATFAIIPIAGPIGDFTFQVTDVNPGLLFIFAITSLNVYGAVLAGTSSNSKFALLGGKRASAQMISYEVFMGLALMGIFMVYGTTRVSGIVNGQNEYWFGNLDLYSFSLHWLLKPNVLLLMLLKASLRLSQVIFLNIQVCAGQLSCSRNMFRWWELQH